MIFIPALMRTELPPPPLPLVWPIMAGGGGIIIIGCWPGAELAGRDCDCWRCCCCLGLITPAAGDSCPGNMGYPPGIIPPGTRGDGAAPGAATVYIAPPPPLLLALTAAAVAIWAATKAAACWATCCCCCWTAWDCCAAWD